ncbi:MAG: hypothetical protein J7M20_05190 [Deltaproteobacteria bacterium]|nr:hypothetical protein [Deltaproteobacteria bacterium]
MMQKNISHEFFAPPEARRQLVDFMDFLKARYADVRHAGKSALSDEPFIGMWRNSEDMRDSSVQADGLL